MAKGNSERYGNHRTEFNRNRKKILKQEEVCALCGQRVDKNLKYPHPYSATIDHKIPLNKGGHPTDISNLQLAHFRCNRLKSDNFEVVSAEQKSQKVSESLNRDLKKIIDWENYRS